VKLGPAHSFAPTRPLGCFWQVGSLLTGRLANLVRETDGRGIGRGGAVFAAAPPNKVVAQADYYSATSHRPASYRGGPEA